MRYRIYSKTPKGKCATGEIEIEGEIFRVCDDHGRVIFGESWPKKEGKLPHPLDTKEPMED